MNIKIALLILSSLLIQPRNYGASFSDLPPEIAQTLLVTIASGSDITSATTSIRNLARTNKNFEVFLKDEHTNKQLLKALSERFKVAEETAAYFLHTPVSLKSVDKNKLVTNGSLINDAVRNYSESKEWNNTFKKIITDLPFSKAHDLYLSSVSPKMVIDNVAYEISKEIKSSDSILGIPISSGQAIISITKPWPLKPGEYMRLVTLDRGSYRRIFASIIPGNKPNEIIFWLLVQRTDQSHELIIQTMSKAGQVISREIVRF